MKSEKTRRGALASSVVGEQMRVRVERLRGLRHRRSSMLGFPEIVGLAAATLLLLTAVFAYFYFLSPERKRLQALQLERGKLQTRLRESAEGVKRGDSAEASVEQILASLRNFEANNLAGRSQGRTAVIEQLNTLIRRNKLRITTGLAFTQFEERAAASGGQTPPRPTTTTAARGGVAQNVFPGIGINMTVEGSYQNLRRFIRDVEASRQFIVINAVELEGVTDSNAPRTTAMDSSGAAAAGGALVSLRLDMAAYFQRYGAPDQSALDATTR